jgi:RNase P subunit RPR2
MFDAVKYGKKWRRLNKKKIKRYNFQHRSVFLKNSKNYRLKMKEKIFEVLGHVCKRCGFSDKRALQVDHINGGGTRHRRDLSRSYFRFYQDILKEPNKYQILCANCNWIKKFENNENKKCG